jgi:hypothetical protein
MLRASPEVMPIPSFKGVRATCRNSAHDRLPSQPRHDAFDRRRVFALQMNNTKGRSVPAFFCQFEPPQSIFIFCNFMAALDTNYETKLQLVIFETCPCSRLICFCGFLYSVKSSLSNCWGDSNPLIDLMKLHVLRVII